MRYVSVCSGAGGFDLGLQQAGWDVQALCEVDRHCRGVLTRHWPAVRLYGDLRRLTWQHGPVDAVVGGTPCQDLSVAGLRRGLAGPSSSLFWHFCRVALAADATWMVWENVPGALTSNHGADFAAVLWGITGALPYVPPGGWRSMGYIAGPHRHAAWRLLDAQWFGVAQRRKRLFVVGGPAGRMSPQVLDLAQGSAQDPRPLAAQRPIASALTRRHLAIASPDAKVGLAHHLVPYVKVARPHGQHDPGRFAQVETAPTLNLNDYSRDVVLVAGEAGVRRLTPLECERLMGWPDDHTRWDATGSAIPDSARYGMTGNGVVAPVAEWVGRQISSCA